jgi:hypothetical protein
MLKEKIHEGGNFFKTERRPKDSYEDTAVNQTCQTVKSEPGFILVSALHFSN